VKKKKDYKPTEKSHERGEYFSEDDAFSEAFAREIKERDEKNIYARIERQRRNDLL